MADEHEGPSAGSAKPLDPPRSSAGCVLATLLVMAAGGYAGWHYFKQPQAGDASKTAKVHPVPVRVAKVRTMTVPVEVHGVGNVLAYSTVAVTSQVTGQLMKVFFKEGDYVTKGQPLFQIDQRPQEASVQQLEATVQKDTAQIGQLEATVGRDAANVNQSRATLLRDEATARFAKVEEARYLKLRQQGYVTVEQSQQEQASAESSEATVNVDRANIASAQQTEKADEASIRSQMQTRNADQASLRNAKVQLTFTYITSPVTGRTGGLSVYTGTVVNPGTGQPLVTIYQIKPIYITFAVPEQYLTLIQTLQARKPLEVEVEFNDQQTVPEWGKITFIDNNVDTTTGTIALRGTFSNTSTHLWPGRFVTLTLHLEDEMNAVVVPSQAVQPAQNGDFVFVVGEDNTVDMRSVKVERIVGANSVIKSGLKPGETVVTDGQLQLNPKTPVEVLSAHHRTADAQGVPGQQPDSADASSPPDASGSPAADSSGAPAHHGHHRHPSPQASGSPVGDAHSMQSYHHTPPTDPLAIPTEPLGAGPAIPPCPAASPTGLGFPAGPGTAGLVVIGSTTTSATGGTALASSTTSPGEAPTGLPGSVNQPGVVSIPGTLNTLQPVSLPSNPAAVAVGPPSLPSPGPLLNILPDSAGTPTPATTTAAATAAVPAAPATVRAPATAAPPATVTGASSTSGAAAGGKSGR